jgi:prepilin-type N-terminal cleavage/methylation domain-containing protein
MNPKKQPKSLPRFPVLFGCGAARRQVWPFPAFIRRAFTLIESMIAVVILSIGMICSLTLMSFTTLQNNLEQERARAHQVVTEQMERVRYSIYTQVTPGSTVTVWDNGTTDTSDDTKGTLEIIARNPAGTKLTAAPVPAVRVQIEVTLSWNPRGRLSTKTFRDTLMTYIAP